MTWRFESTNEEEASVRPGSIVMNAIFATAITALAVYFLL